MFTVINLETNHRQGADGEFADLLNRLRVVSKGEMMEEDIKTLTSRVRPVGHADLKGASVNIICTRKKGFQMNTKYLKQHAGDEITIKAVNYMSNQRHFKPTLHKSGDGSIAKTGYMNELKLKVGAKVMLIKNIRTEDSLTNGQTGVLVATIKDKKGEVQKLMVKFDKEDAGKMTRSESPNLLQKYPGATKVEKALESYSLSGSSGSKANLIQFPIVLSHAVTAHKTQGMTIHKPKTSSLDLDSTFEAAQGYVALGRNQALEQLFIMNKFDPDKIYAAPKALEEYERMNDRSINQNPGEWDKVTIKIVAMNIARLEPHIEDIKVDPTLKKADIIHLCETWVSPEEEAGDVFKLEGYQAGFVSVGKVKGLATFYKDFFHHTSDVSEPNYQITINS